MIKFQDLDRKLCVRVRPFFLVLWIILAQHRLGGGNKNKTLKKLPVGMKIKKSQTSNFVLLFLNDIRI